MSFNSTAIFPFPAVQYIPLAITNIHQGALPKSNFRIPISKLIAGAELEKWRTVLWQDYSIQIPPSFPEESFPLLALNLKVFDVKYRGFFVTMLGEENRDSYQLFTIPKGYFYKPKLFFEVFEEKSGRLLAQYSLFMP